MTEEDDFLSNFSETAGIGSLLNNLTQPAAPKATAVEAPAQPSGFGMFAAFSEPATATQTKPAQDNEQRWGSKLFGSAKQQINWHNASDFANTESPAAASSTPLQKVGSMSFAELCGKVNWTNTQSEEPANEPEVTDHSKSNSVGSMLSDFAW